MSAGHFRPQTNIPFNNNNINNNNAAISVAQNKLTAVQTNVFSLRAKVCKETDGERRFAGKLFHT